MSQGTPKLSIIIPYYNTKTYTDELLSCLNSQITNDVQVILVDDGSTKKYSTEYDWVQVIRKQNGGVSSARNVGIEHAKGRYIAFIDSDDLVSDNYIQLILSKIKSESFDYCYLSWKSFGGWEYEVNLKTIDDKFPPFNLCCWNRVYKRSLVNNIRFNESKKIAEDAEYIREAEKDMHKKAFIESQVYFYRSDSENSLTKRFARGDIETRRIVYYYPRVTPDMTWLIDEVEELDRDSEVIIMTDSLEIPELANHAMISKPIKIAGNELRGCPTRLFNKIECPIRAQVVIWTQRTFEIGGIETFIYNFCTAMHDKYDILVLYDVMDKNQINRLSRYVSVVKNNTKQSVVCDYLLVNRITDSIPENISFGARVQMVHCCKLESHWKIPDGDYHVFPTAAVAKSYGSDGNVVHNFSSEIPAKRPLRLISATRLTAEKGWWRMLELARKLEESNIPFIWTVFTNEVQKEPVPYGMVFMKPTLNVADYMIGNDYLVQLSDSEAYCYSIVEALTAGVPVITTPLPVLDEIGFVDGKTGIVLPFDMEKVDVDRIYNSKFSFDYKIDNNEIRKQWEEILGNKSPKHDGRTKIYITKDYNDVQLGRLVNKGEILYVSSERASKIKSAGFCNYGE